MHNLDLSKPTNTRTITLPDLIDHDLDVGHMLKLIEQLATVLNRIQWEEECGSCPDCAHGNNHANYCDLDKALSAAQIYL